MLTRINEHQEELSQIWPGYDASRRFYGYVDADRYVYLNRSTAAPSKFQPQRNGFWKSHKPYPELNGIFHINAQLAPDLQATVIEAGARKNYLALTSLILHEDFHGFQRERFSQHYADAQCNFASYFCRN